MHILSSTSTQRKLAATLVALLMALLAFTSGLNLLLDKTPVHHLDRQAETYVEGTMARAAATFAIVRGLNGVVSAIQGTHIAVSPAGIGLSFSIGEVLDPINDLAERFSWVMLVSTVSLGLQRVLMEMSDWLGLQVLLSAALVMMAAAVWKRFWGIWDLRSVAFRLMLLALVVRFFIPAVALLSQSIYDRFLDPHYQEATRALTRLSDELKQADPITRAPAASPDPEKNVQSWRHWLDEARDLFDMRARIERIGSKLEHFTEEAIRLMVVFVLQTIVIPLSTLWILLKIASVRHVVAPLWPPARPSDPIR